MGMIVGESGKLFGYNTNFDLTGNTSLALEFHSPAWGTPIVIDPSRLSVGTVDKVFDENGISVTYKAGEYIQFIVLETDFTLAGPWQVCGTYSNNNVTPEQIFKGEIKSFSVELGC